MDDFIDPFLSSPSWSDMNTSSRSSWVETDSMEAYGGDEKNPSLCMIPSSHIMGNVAAHDLDLHAHDDTSSLYADGKLKYIPENELPNRTLHPPQHDNGTHQINFSLNGVIKSALTMSSSLESNGSEPSNFPQSLGDAHSISSVSTMWPPSYSGVSSFMGQGKLQGFGFQDVESDADILRGTCVESDKYPHLNNLSEASLHDHNELHNTHLPTFTAGQQEENELHNLHLPSFAAGPQRTSSKTTGIQNHQELSHSTEGTTVKHHTNHSSGVQSQPPPSGGGCNGAAKPRVRARRGQATDPHSIAERLRREKIAERMKNLQELVPNSNKTDKASMLDEIIGYVKFLQLQVKVLSMSRLGAAGAVVPLITDAQAEGSGTLHLSSVGQGGTDLSDTQDTLAFEQEVVRLMESNVTTAMQYLQNKGLCLMPIALAAAISSQKGSSAAIPPERRKSDASSPSSGQSLAERNGREDGGPNSCNGGGIKEEEAMKA